MPAVKRFSVSFAKHPTNGTSASFRYISTSPPPFVLHVFGNLSLFVHFGSTSRGRYYHVSQPSGVFSFSAAFPFTLSLPHIIFVTTWSPSPNDSKFVSEVCVCVYTHTSIIYVDDVY